jgi:hypothetical protein
METIAVSRAGNEYLDPFGSVGAPNLSRTTSPMLDNQISVSMTQKTIEATTGA